MVTKMTIHLSLLWTKGYSLYLNDMGLFVHVSFQNCSQIFLIISHEAYRSDLEKSQSLLSTLSYKSVSLKSAYLIWYYTNELLRIRFVRYSCLSTSQTCLSSLLDLYSTCHHQKSINMKMSINSFWIHTELPGLHTLTAIVCIESKAQESHKVLRSDS